MSIDRRQFNQLALASSLSLMMPTSWAQKDAAENYPNRPVRFICPFSSGGGTDIVARAIAQKMTEKYGQPFVVDNRPGANGTLGVDMTVKSPADGYTITMLTSSHSVNVTMQKQQPYNMLRDIAPITQATTQPYVLIVNPKLPVKNLAELIELAKQKKTLTYGSSGIGGFSHLAGALFADKANIPITHIPYKGGSPAMNDVISGQIDMLFSTIIQSHGHIQTGRLRPIAVTTKKRHKALPDTPTMEEGGLPGYEVTAWYGVAAPAGVPAPIIQKLNKAMSEILKTPYMEERLLADGSEAVGSTPEEFGQHLRTEIAKWRDLIKKVGINPDA